MAFPQATDYRPPIIPDGEIYDNLENGKSYYWTQILLPEGSTPDTATSIGGYWTVVCEETDPRFVLKAGDTMTGTLEIANEGDTTDVDFDPDKANLTFTTTKTDGSASTSVSIHQNGYNSSIGITGGVVADGSYFSQSGKYYGADPSGQYFSAWSPRLQLEELVGTLRWNDSARVQWNEFNVEIPKPVEDDQDSDGLIIRGTTAIGYETTDPDDQDGKLFSVYHNADTADAVNYKGKIYSANNLVNKGYVDEKDELLRQDIIELEEEIDAIAPSLEYGNWEWVQPTSNLRAPEKGTFYLLDGSNQLTTEYKDTKVVVINNYEYDDPADNDPVDIHTWADADAGELIQLFDAADPDFVLGKIVAVNPDTETGSSGTLEFVRIEIELIQSSGVPNDNADPVTGKFLTRVNIFKEPSGGTASEFVLKSGDTMTGQLQMGKVTADTPDGTDSPKIRFEAKSSGGSPYATYLYAANSNYLLTTGNFYANGTIHSKSIYGFGYDGSTRMGFGTKDIDGAANIDFGYLGIGTGNDVRAMEWSGPKGLYWLKAYGTAGSKGQVLKKDRTNNRPKWEGMVNISPSGQDRSVGELWYNSNDQVLYLRVS